jgi:hypothetical protein
MIGLSESIERGIACKIKGQWRNAIPCVLTEFFRDMKATGIDNSSTVRRAQLAEWQPPGFRPRAWRARGQRAKVARAKERRWR